MLRHRKTRPASCMSLRRSLNDPVQHWLYDIRGATEMECTSILQGKSILDTMDKQAVRATHVKSSIDIIRKESHQISNEFAKLFRHAEDENWTTVQSFTIKLTCHIRSLIQECNQSIPHSPAYILEQQEIVMGECAKLAQQVESALMHKKNPPSKIPIVNQLTFLGQAFSRLVDLALGYLVQRVVDTLDEANDPVTLSNCMGAVVSLGLEGEHMCYIIAREGGVRALLDICRTDSLDFAHSQALRALATISCVNESLFEIEKEGGVECLLDILCDSQLGERVRGEVAGVIAQVTSPCLENAHQLSGLMENIEDLLRCLLGLCYATRSEEVFLLSSAAIANITFMDNQACETLLQLEAPRILIGACSTTVADSLFAKDQLGERVRGEVAGVIAQVTSPCLENAHQLSGLMENIEDLQIITDQVQVATVLANMVAVDVCRHDILSHGGISLALQLLNERPCDYKSPAEISACERVQQKAAIALTRMCREEEVAEKIVDSQGIPRLIQLCRLKKERSNSDAVLVACLAALRKIKSLNKLEGVSGIDVQQLINPKLMDSFLICTNSDENFV